jgi:hypothetical protein
LKMDSESEFYNPQTCSIWLANIVDSSHTRVPKVLVLCHWPSVVPGILPK